VPPVPATTPKPPTPKPDANGSRSIPLPKIKGNPNVNRDHTIVVFAMIGTAGVLIVSDIHAGKFPSARQLVGLGFVFAAIAALTAIAPAIAVPFALLVFAGVLLNKGLGFFSGIGIASSSKTALTGTPQPGQSTIPQSYSAGSTPLGNYYDQTPSPKAERAVRFALAARGTPYVYGGTTPNGYDCSGLCMAAYLAAGVHIPRTSEGQYQAGYHAVQWGMWAPGDLIFSQWPGDGTAPGHVVMYVGQGKCIAAPHTGATVEIEPVSTFQKPHYWGSVRPAPLPDTGTAHRHR
jgi:cell wall-associated NlpC family hydrolase